MDRALAMEDRKRHRILEIERRWKGWREGESIDQKKIKRERECVFFKGGK